MVVRELLTKLGFKVDESQFKKAEGLSNKVLSGVGKAAFGIGAAIAAVGGFAVKTAADMEMLTTQFEVMLGSSEKATAMMAKLNTFAASTPFALGDLAKGSQQLLSFGVAEEKVVNTMRMLGDTAGGNAEKLSGLVLAYGKVQTKGKASMEEINMLAERGVPIIGTLQKQLGVTNQEFFKMVSAGKISKTEITKAFKTMTSEGGMFFKGMEKQSKTFGGLWSTLMDNIKLAFAGLGEAFLPDMKEFVKMATTYVQQMGKAIKDNRETIVTNFKKVVDILKKVINVFEFLFKIVSNEHFLKIAGAITIAVIAFAAMVKVIALVKAAMIALKIIMNTNPILLAITAAIAAIMLLIFYWDDIVFAAKKAGVMIQYAWNQLFNKLKQAFQSYINMWLTGVRKILQLIDKVTGSKLALKVKPIDLGIKDVGELKKEMQMKMNVLNTEREKAIQKAEADKKVNNISMKNDISITNPSGTTSKDALTQAADVAFSIQLKKVLVTAGV